MISSLPHPTLSIAITVKARQRGVTLVELMISVVIGLVIVAAASTVYLYSKQAFNSASETSQVEENGKFALNLLTRSIQSAGFVMLDPAFPSQGPSDPKMRGCDFGFVNSTAPTNTTLATDLGCLAAAPANARQSASLSVFTETDTPTTAATASAFEGFNCVGTSATANTVAGVSVWQTRSHFFVGSSTVQTPAGPVTMGQLTCIADTTSAAGVPSFERQPLIPGIEQINFNYLLPGAVADTAQASTSATTLATSTDGWKKVLAVDVCVLAKSTQPASNDMGTTTYTDCYNNSKTAAAGEVYRTFKTTVRVRNKSI